MSLEKESCFRGGVSCNILMKDCENKGVMCASMNFRQSGLCIIKKVCVALYLLPYPNSQ